MNKVFIGIDPGFMDTAIIGIRDKEVIINDHIKVDPKKYDTPRKQIEIYDTLVHEKLDDIISAYNPGEVSIMVEQPAGRNMGNGVKVQWAFAVIVLAIKGLSSYEYHVFNSNYCLPKEVKKFAAKKGNANKIAMAQAAAKAGFESDNDNSIDAYWLARYAQKMEG